MPVRPAGDGLTVDLDHVGVLAAGEIRFVGRASNEIQTVIGEIFLAERRRTEAIADIAGRMRALMDDGRAESILQFSFAGTHPVFSQFVKLMESMANPGHAVVFDVPEGADAMLASADALTFRVHGKGGHASAPHEAVDPIPVAAELILALQAMVTRTVDVFDPAVVTIAHIEAGFANNIIPETVFLEGTLRTVSEERRAAVKESIARVAAGVGATHGARIELTIEPGYPVTVNDPAFASWALGIARGLLGEASVEEVPAPIMGAEDFSYVLQQVPGAMFFIGARHASVPPEEAQANHSNKVVFDEAAMAAGAALYAAIALTHADR